MLAAEPKRVANLEMASQRWMPFLPPLAMWLDSHFGTCVFDKHAQHPYVQSWTTTGLAGAVIFAVTFDLFYTHIDDIVEYRCLSHR